MTQEKFDPSETISSLLWTRKQRIELLAEWLRLISPVIENALREPEQLFGSDQGAGNTRIRTVILTSVSDSR